MSKKTVYSTILVIVLMGVLGASFNVHKVEAPYPIIYIRADGSIDPSTANITSSDNVTYTFTADIDASIVVERNYTVVDGANFTVQGSGGGTGIDLSCTNNVTLQNVKVSNFSQGINLIESSHNTVAGSTASNNTEGIFLFDSSYNTITGNVASNNGGDGIFLTFSHNNTIAGNNVSNSSSLGIQLYSCSHNIIIGNTASNNTEGIFLFDSSHNTITGNSLTTNSNAGIRLQSSSNNSIYENRMVKSGNAISLDHSSQNTISRNNVTLCVYNGIIISESSYNTISENAVTNNPFQLGGSSIGLSLSSNNFLLKNNITTNNYWGILSTISNNNTIVENIIRNNTVGINCPSSVFNFFSANNIIDNRFSGIYLEDSANNTFLHNNLINNTNQVVFDLEHANNWDDGNEGNYWSNYTGADSNHDGIGDSWHEINENNTDHCPLMGPFSSYTTSPGKNVAIISNSTVDKFQYESPSTIRFYVSNTTANQTQGFCRVSIPYEVMSEPFNVTVDGANPTFWSYTLYDNGTHRWIYFEYVHTTREIVIIPEFPSLLILPLFMIATLLAVIVYRRKHSTYN